MANVQRFFEQLIGRFFGGGNLQGLVGLLAAILAIDYVAALICALLGRAKHGGSLSSRVGFMGILRKSLIFAVVGVAHIIDEALGSESLCPLTIKGFIVNEGISVIQNISLAGTWIPPVLKERLKRIAGANDRKDTGQTT